MSHAQPNPTLSATANSVVAVQPAGISPQVPAGLPVQHFEPRACDSCEGTGRKHAMRGEDPCTSCDGMGRTVALRSPQDGGEPLPATNSALAEQLRAIVTNDLEVTRPELPDWLLDRLTLLAYAAETINRKRTSDENLAKVTLAMREALGLR